MLTEREIRERAEYCYCVFYQLNCLLANDRIPPEQYLKYLTGSSLGLGNDEFITMTITDELCMGNQDGGIPCLAALYEGFAHAFCEVLESSIQDLHNSISSELLNNLTNEMTLPDDRNS